MTELVPFVSGEFELAVTLHADDGFRVQAPGLARALGFREAYDLLRSIPDTEKGSELVRTPGGDQRIGYLTEVGFYRAMGQRQVARIPDLDQRSAVERFQSWVYRDVIPEIRRTGYYGTAPAPRVELSRLELIEIARTAELERLALETKVAELEPRLEAAEARNTRNEPKVSYVETYVEPARDTAILRVLAKQLGIPEKALRDELQARKVLYRRIIGTRWSNSQSRMVTEYQWLPHAGYESWFSLRDQPDAPRLHNGQLRTTLYVTPAGKAGIQKLLTAKPVGELESAADRPGA